MFWLTSHGLVALALKHPPVHLWVDVGPVPVKAVMRGAGCHDDPFIKGPHLITLESGHMDTQEKRLLYGGRMWSDLSHTSNHKPLSDPHGSSFTWTGFQSSVLRPKRFPPTRCQSWPNKPVYVLNTVGTLNIPDRRYHRQVITAITSSY